MDQAGRTALIEQLEYVMMQLRLARVTISADMVARAQAHCELASTKLSEVWEALEQFVYAR